VDPVVPQAQGRTGARTCRDELEAGRLARSGTPTGEGLLYWVGIDDRGLELEIVAVELSDGTALVIHVMPTLLRRSDAPTE
jgi:hypothetical protein